MKSSASEEMRQHDLILVPFDILSFLLLLALQLAQKDTEKSGDEKRERG